MRSKKISNHYLHSLMQDEYSCLTTSVGLNHNEQKTLLLLSIIILRMIIQDETRTVEVIYDDFAMLVKCMRWGD
jgi:hypothetical protein